MGCAASVPVPVETPRPPPSGAPIGAPVGGGRSNTRQEDYNNDTVSISTIRGQEKLTLSRGASVVFRKTQAKPGMPNFGDMTPSAIDVTPVDTPSTKATLVKQLSPLCKVHYACVSVCGRGASSSSLVTSKANQDSWIVSEEWSPSGGFIAGVMDGHGPYGEHVAQYVSRQIIPNLIASTKSPENSTSPNFVSAFSATQAGLESTSAFDINLSGTTAVTLYISRDVESEGGARFFCANVGDSRAILISSPQASSPLVTSLSNDHKPDLDSEYKRVVANAKPKALEILSERELGIGNPNSTTNKRYMCRMNQQRGTIKYGIMFTRSLGDGDAHEYVGVTHEPEVISSVWEFGKHSAIILASDGVWDALSNDQAAQVVLTAMKGEDTFNCQRAAQALVDAARAIWDEDTKGRRDDITAMIISLEKNIVNSGSTQKTPISTDEPTSSSPSSSPRAKKNEEVSNDNIPIAPVVQPDVQVLSVKSDETTDVVKVEDVVPSITTDAAAAAAQGTPTPSSGENN
jgi:serine/threonine protein phosphatase PrpC